MLISIRMPNNSQKLCKESVNQIKKFQGFLSGRVVCKHCGADVGKCFVILN